jgi:hypothetical protein
MDIPLEVLIVGGVGILGVIIILVGFVLQRRRVDLTGPDEPEEKPQWMHEMPPPETVAATQADGEGITLYDYDEGELVASAFAEQIEDVVRARVSEDPSLAGLDVDFGTGPDGGLEAWVDGVKYASINQIPNERLKELIRQAIEIWNQGQV